MFEIFVMALSKYAWIIELIYSIYNIIGIDKFCELNDPHLTRSN